jgi:hypothetical protein
LSGYTTVHHFPAAIFAEWWNVKSDALRGLHHFHYFRRHFPPILVKHSRECENGMGGQLAKTLVYIMSLLCGGSGGRSGKLIIKGVPYSATWRVFHHLTGGNAAESAP